MSRRRNSRQRRAIRARMAETGESYMTALRSLGYLDGMRQAGAAVGRAQVDEFQAAARAAACLVFQQTGRACRSCR